MGVELGMLVQGAVAAGAPAAGNPHLLGGIDGAGNVQCLSSNQDLTVLASAARTATTLSADLTNRNGCGLAVYLNVTAASGTGGLQVFLQGKDALGNYYQLNSAPTAITATGQHLYVLYPGATNTGGSADQACGGLLPATWRIRVVHGDSSSYTYSVCASVIL